MPKLSTIDEVERAAAETADDLEMREAQEAMRAAQAPAEPAQVLPDALEGADEEPADISAAEEIAPKSQRANVERTASQEEDFHGLSSTQRMGAGQIALIVAAVVVCIAAVLYVVNSWVHFI